MLPFVSVISLQWSYSIHQMIGVAEAAAIEAIGKADAERMRQKAAAYKQYGDAALMALVLDAMPKVCLTFIWPYSDRSHL